MTAAGLALVLAGLVVLVFLGTTGPFGPLGLTAVALLCVAALGQQGGRR